MKTDTNYTNGSMFHIIKMEVCFVNTTTLSYIISQTLQKIKKRNLKAYNTVKIYISEKLNNIVPINETRH